ncbi:MAG: methylmalonyl-CoA decarboxylase [Isosphaeraceae bacterium]
MALVRWECEDRVGTVWLDDARRRNALSSELVEETVGALGSLADRKARVVILRGPAGSKVWSAGHDIRELPRLGREPLGWSDSLRVLIRAVQENPCPVIARIEGSVWGGACELAMACDLAIATPEVTFAITPARLGIPYNLTGLLTLMNALPLPIAKEMLFTARPIDAARALALGVLNRVVPAEEIDAVVLDLARAIAANSPRSIAVIKEELRLLASARSISPETFERMQGLRRTVYDSPDYQEGQRAFFEKRPPEFLDPP